MKSNNDSEEAKDNLLASLNAAFAKLFIKDRVLSERDIRAIRDNAIKARVPRRDFVDVGKQLPERNVEELLKEIGELMELGRGLSLPAAGVPAVRPELSKATQMTLDEFRQSLATTEPPPGLTLALTGLWWDAKGDWNRAHESTLQDKGPEGSWVHAYLHRKEGNQGNAANLYKRAGKPVCQQPLDAEWLTIATALLQGDLKGERVFAGHSRDQSGGAMEDFQKMMKELLARAPNKSGPPEDPQLIIERLRARALLDRGCILGSPTVFVVGKKLPKLVSSDDTSQVLEDVSKRTKG
jgi:hypothetical protein